MKKISIIKLLLVTSLALIGQFTIIAQTKGDGNYIPDAEINVEIPPPPPGIKYIYEYDNNGNRVKSYFHSDVVGATTKSAILDTIYQEEKMILPNEVNFYPNPTTGLVKVSIQGFEEDLVWNAQIYSASGKLIYNDRITTPMFQFDLSIQEAGVYILRIQGGDLFNEWKIIKQ